MSSNKHTHSDMLYSTNLFCHLPSSRSAVIHLTHEFVVHKESKSIHLFVVVLVVVANKRQNTFFVVVVVVVVVECITEVTPKAHKKTKQQTKA
jgi:hypothetical protein